MWAIEVSRHGGPEVLQYREVPDPAPGPDQLLVRPTGIGVNFIDTYMRAGIYPTQPPFIPGQEGTGVVVAVGPQANGFEVGQRVAWANVDASYAELVTMPAALAIAVPDAVDDQTAAALPLQGMTAQYLSSSTYAISPGDIALVQAAAGGTGQLLTQFIVSRGGVVIGVVGSAAKVVVARAAGAAHVIDRSETPDIAAVVRRYTDGRGVDVVYDGVGKATFAAGLASLRSRGMMVLFGGASGQVPPFDPQQLNQRGSLFLTRPKLGDYISDPVELRIRATDVFTRVAAGLLRVEVGGTFPLADAGAAHAALQGGGTTGKLLLLPN